MLFVGISHCSNMKEAILMTEKLPILSISAVTLIVLHVLELGRNMPYCHSSVTKLNREPTGIL